MLGALDMFNIGIGPSSSHTIGPMKAAKLFIDKLISGNSFDSVMRIKAHLFGSLALTGEGHGTVLAMLNGLLGKDPKTVDPKEFIIVIAKIKETNSILLNGVREVTFIFSEDILLHKNETLPEHPNGMRFEAFNFKGDLILVEEYFSVGGGFVVSKLEMSECNANTNMEDIPYPFKTANELFGFCRRDNITIAELVTRNELHRSTRDEVRKNALNIINVMHDSVISGLNSTETILPGGLHVRRRAPNIYKNLTNKEAGHRDTRLLACCYAIAVNEENATFSRIVTAPTNGAAGTIPGVLEYYRNFCANVNEDKLVEFILTAGAIGMLYKFGASISAAEVGCQGEIGVACSMASGALTAVLGGSLIQIEKATEIGMEHNLGMTCDPVGGLVQIPCIERNGIAASKAIDIANLALLEEEVGKISLDGVIKTMLQTGKDMTSKYKETALGGLAVNYVNC